MGSAMTPEYMRRLLIAPSEPSRNFQVGGVTLLAERMIVRPVTDGHQLHGLFAPSPNKRAPAEADAPFEPFKAPSGYIFFSSHILVVAFHVPPAFAQSASVFAAVAPAKTGPEKASARVIAKVVIRIFMGFFSVTLKPPQTNVFCRIAFQKTDPIGVQNRTEADA